MKQALIVTGGRAELGFCRAYIRQQNADIMIAVDSGMQFFYDAKIKPDMIVGDFDSVDPETLQFFEGQEGIEWLRLNPQKDDTDTEAAIRRAVAEGCKQIHVLGGTGSRLDHVLGNIELLGIGLKEDAEIFLVDSCNRIRMIADGLSISKEEQYGDYISLIPFTPQVTGVTLKGMKYPLTDASLVCYNSLGISNEIIDQRADICIKSGVLLVLETKDDHAKKCNSSA